jgi:hypothetical protein
MEAIRPPLFFFCFFVVVIGLYLFGLILLAKRDGRQRNANAAAAAAANANGR